VQSRIKALDKMERVEMPAESRARIRLRIPEPPRSGDPVLRLGGVHKRYGERVVYAGIDFLMRRGERVALVGPNGAGKSTLLRIAAGVLPVDAGTRELGHRVEVAFYAQHQLEVLDPSRSVLEELESVAHTDDVPRLRGHLGAFLFSGDDVAKRVSVLSGGEKARLALARMLLRPSNFLVMDEPTNHLDLVACEVLEAALEEYEGTLLFISHDRSLIDAIATRVVEVRAGTLRDHLGGYAAWRRATAAEESGVGVASGATGRPAPGTAAEDAPPASTREERIARRERERAAARDAVRGRRRLAALEAEIASIETRLEELAARLAAPDLWRDGGAARALEAEHESLRDGLAARYREWGQLASALEAEGAES